MTDEQLKKIYKELENDQYIIDSLNEINRRINFVIDHGTLHVKNLEKYADKICEVFNLSERTKWLAKIAILFHDFGRLDGREEHSKKSLVYAEKYLKDKVDKEELDLILDAILRHELELFDFNSKNDVAYVVIMADKLDYTKDRYIESLMKEKYKNVYSYKIKSFEIENVNNQLKIVANAYDIEQEMVEKFKRNFELFKKVAKHFGIEKTEMEFLDINTKETEILK